MNIRNAKHNADGSIDCEIQHPKHGWIPFTAAANDIEAHGRAVHAACLSGDAGEVAPYVPPDPPALESVRAQVVAKINTWRDVQEQAQIVFEWGGRQWDGGLRVRTHLQPVVALPELPPGFFWTDYNNEDVPVTVADVAALNAAHEAALIAQGWAIHVRQREMKTEVELLATAAEVLAYPVGWPEVE